MTRHTAAEIALMAVVTPSGSNRCDLGRDTGRTSLREGCAARRRRVAQALLSFSSRRVVGQRTFVAQPSFSKPRISIAEMSI